MSLTSLPVQHSFSFSKHCSRPSLLTVPSYCVLPTTFSPSHTLILCNGIVIVCTLTWASIWRSSYTQNSIKHNSQTKHHTCWNGSSILNMLGIPWHYKQLHSIMLYKTMSNTHSCVHCRLNANPTKDASCSVTQDIACSHHWGYVQPFIVIPSSITPILESEFFLSDITNREIRTLILHRDKVVLSDVLGLKRMISPRIWKPCKGDIDFMKVRLAQRTLLVPLREAIRPSRLFYRRYSIHSRAVAQNSVMAHQVMNQILPTEAETRLFTTLKAALKFQIEKQKQNEPHVEHPSQLGQYTNSENGDNDVHNDSKKRKFTDYSQTELRCAGGWVRDKLLGLESDDIDIAINNMTGQEFGDCVNQFYESQSQRTTTVRTAHFLVDLCTLLQFRLQACQVLNVKT